MPLSYDGTGRVVSLPEALTEPGTPLPNRQSRAAANNATAWILDCNPSEDAGVGSTDMKYDYEMRAKMDPMIDNSVSQKSGTGATDMVRNLGL